MWIYISVGNLGFGPQFDYSFNKAKAAKLQSHKNWRQPSQIGYQENELQGIMSLQN
jgi:hypothetical protein